MRKSVIFLLVVAFAVFSCTEHTPKFDPKIQEKENTVGTIRATLNGLEITIDKKTGTIRKMKYPGPGTLLEAEAGEAGLVDVAYPLPEFEPLRLAARYTEDAKIEVTSGQIIIRIAKLGSSRTCFPLTGEVTATVTLKADSDGKSIIMSCVLENKTDLAVRQVIFPELCGLIAVAGPDHTVLKSLGSSTNPFRELLLSGSDEVYSSTRAMKEYNPDSNWDRIAGRWLDLSGLNGGFSIFPKRWGWDPHVSTILHLPQTSRRLRMLYKNPEQEIVPGGIWSSGEWVLTPHKSGWAKGIEPYREWVRSHMQRKYPLPKHIREGLGFRSIWMSQNCPADPNDAVWRFSDFPKLAKEAYEHGLTEMVPWCWTKESFSARNITPNPRLGSEKEMIEAVKACRLEGVNVAMFISEIQVGKKDAPRYGLKILPDNHGWNHHLELLPRFNPSYASQHASKEVSTANTTWQNDVAESLKQWADKGITSWTWDQYWVTKEAHIQNLTARIRDYARKLNPQSSFAGETMLNIEVDCDWLDYTWNWFNVPYGDIQAITRFTMPKCDMQAFTSAFPSPRLNININRLASEARYAFMDNLFLNVWPTKPDGVNGSDYISAVPELSRTLKNCAGLRKQFLPYFTEGILIGNCLMTKPDSTVRMTAYVMPDRIMAIILNESKTEKKLDFSYDLSLWVPGSEYTVSRFDELGKIIDAAKVRVSGSLHTEKLKQYEIEVFEIRKNK